MIGMSPPPTSLNKPQNVNHLGNRRGVVDVTPCATQCQTPACHLTRTSKEQPRTTDLLTTYGALCGSLNDTKNQMANVRNDWPPQTDDAFTTTPRNLHTRHHVVRAFDTIPIGTNERKKKNKDKKKMRSTNALSRMRHTSHISCHAQKANLCAAPSEQTRQSH